MSACLQEQMTTEFTARADDSKTILTYKHEVRWQDTCTYSMAFKLLIFVCCVLSAFSVETLMATSFQMLFTSFTSLMCCLIYS